jgi:agmatine deiminase
MISDPQTNTIYFAEDTREEYPEEFAQLEEIVVTAGFSVKVLEGTMDFFCRDYMPVQIAKNDFMQFLFKPERYVEEKEYQFISNPVIIAMTNQLPSPRNSPVVLDGGNVIRWNNKVIITDRVYKDNAHQFSSKEAIRKELEKNLQCRVIIIPEYPNEETGHADGLIRFIDGNRVFINEIRDEPESDWLGEFLAVLEDNDLSYVEIPCPLLDNQETAVGLYINYLHVGKLVILPQFDGLIGDNERAVQIVKATFPSSYTVVSFRADWIAGFGGVFNCICWGVLS